MIMQADKNGRADIPSGVEPFPALSKNEIDASLETPVYDPKAKREIPTLERPAPGIVLHVRTDIKNRNDPRYLHWFHTEFMPDVRERGIQVPLIGYRETERIRVIDGETRLLAALLAGGEKCQTIPVMVYAVKPEDTELKFAQLLANTARRDMTALELAAVYLDLMRDLKITAAELARLIHANPAAISRCISISTKLCPEVQAMVVDGLQPRAAYSISRLTDVPTQIDLATQVRDGILSVEGVEHRVQTILSGKKREKPKIHTLKVGGGTAIIKGSLTEGLETMIGKLQELLKAIRKRGDDPLPA
jgi:ParB/RepB/Spo0J family partition protein